jgi:TonB family protein
MRFTRAAACGIGLVMAAGVALIATTASVRPAQTPPARVTVEQLKLLKLTSNDPAGDAFVGSRDELSRLIDAIANDSSLLSPMYLFLASKTALNLNRLADAAFLYYAAQLRVAFDFERYDVASQPDGNNAATYLGFLRQTIGMSVNPAIMREPVLFSAVIDRIDRWEIVPARDAFYPEFASAKGFKIAPEKWADTAATIKQGFLTQFGRRQARLLNDPEYFEAFRFVQTLNFGEVPDSPANRARFEKSLATMEAAEKRLFPSSAPVRVGSRVPEPKLLRRIEPEFPPGATGSVILEVTIGPEGTVTDVRILRSVAAALDAAAVKAVRQWVYAATLIDGRAVPVIQTVVVTAR